MIPRQLRIGLLALSAISDDLRVRRQGDAFRDAGWDVIAFGLQGGTSAPPDWRIVEVDAACDPAQATKPDWLRRSHLVRRTLLLSRVLASRVAPSMIDRAYWQLNSNYGAMLEAARQHRVDIWLANDWMTLPIASLLAAEQGVPYAYDTHELATEEYAQSWRWRMVRKPLIHQIEAAGIAKAAIVSCVSGGIARRLVEIHGLKRPPFLLRNIPASFTPPPRPVSDRIRVLYHGVVAPGRGLETCIVSAAFWRPEFDFTIRGPATPEYQAHLRKLIEAAGMESRVTLAPPVSATDLVAAATDFDVGLFALPAHSLHNIYALPNKFFEYTAAGLALCVSDLPEMASLVDQHNLGVMIRDVTPQGIAEAVNGLDLAKVEAFKANARAASKVLNARLESGPLLAEFRRVVEMALEG